MFGPRVGSFFFPRASGRVGSGYECAFRVSGRVGSGQFHEFRATGRAKMLGSGRVFGSGQARLTPNGTQIERIYLIKKSEISVVQMKGPGM